VVVRTFDLGLLNRPWGWLHGQIVVTDARVIYRARAKNWMNESMTSREIQVSDISGLALATTRGLQLVNLFAILVGGAIGWFAVNLVAGAIVVASYLGGDRGYSAWVVVLYLLLLVAVGFMLWVRARATAVHLVIYARSVEQSPIALTGSARNGGFGVFGLFVVFITAPLLLLGRWLGIVDAAEATNSADTLTTQRIYEQLGPLILDIQARGTLAAGDD